MYNFDFEVPTKILFGKGKIEHLAEELVKHGDRVLLCYGGGSIKRIGLYDQIVQSLEHEKIFFKEFGGISPNPRIDEVKEGARIIKENSLNFILAVGGGSAIDCAKAISAAVNYKGDAWEIIKNKPEIKEAIPIGTVLTLSATGSEMNCGSVISNMETKEKLGFGSPMLLPKFSILDPTYTYSVPKKHTAAGTADMMSHTIENYFTLNDHAFLQSRFAEAILKTCIKYAPIAMREPDNYEARANLMWVSTWAINGLLSKGKQTAWSVHPLEHELSAFYDITHGVGLAILTPHWMKTVLNDKTVNKFVNYGMAVWGLPEDADKYKTANLAIQKTSDFFKGLEMPMTLGEVGIGDEHLQEMAEAAIEHKGINGKILGFQEIDVKMALEIYKSAKSEFQF